MHIISLICINYTPVVKNMYKTPMKGKVII